MVLSYLHTGLTQSFRDAAQFPAHTGGPDQNIDLLRKTGPDEG